ncbi:MAG: tRNA pseudouridine(13) synthase TruD [Myxococcales bacterium]|nr:tRNA pseudouridine(13) synthase TruD [Myxococcales bacterium]
MDDLWRARILDPPLQTPSLPGVGGRIRRRPDDFVVEERPAYAPDGTPGAHLLLTLTKRGLSSEDAAVALAAHLGIDRRAVGLAGRKDRNAVTTQWVSVPAEVAAGLASFEHPAITLGQAHPHGNKLRTGHLHGNRFDLVIRQLRIDPTEAMARARATLAALDAGGGLANLYGPQRFGRDGHQLDRGLASLRGGRSGRRGNLVVAAGQAALFNLYALLRRERGLERTVLAGDLLQKRASGGMFECSDPHTDQARLDAGELVITGPIFGARMRAPSPDTPAAALEADALAQAGIETAALARLGRKTPGTRRVLHVPLDACALEPAPPIPEEDLGPGLRLRFELPAGSFATQLCRELQGDADHPPDLDPD